MITIKCTELEKVRKSPIAYAQLLASENTSSAGSHSMFACVKEVARSMHTKEKTLSAGIKELQSKFLKYAINVQNTSKQEKLTDQFIKYFKAYEKMNFEWVDGNRQMKWNMASNSKLTGLTPWVVENEKGLYSYLITQNEIDWKNELRFPLFQKYLSDATLKCNLDKLHIGVFNLSTGSFDFNCFSTKQIKETVEETIVIFNEVTDAFKKIKK
jgi:hypothetical protein